MDAKLFMQILNDKHFNNLTKLQYKYDKITVLETVELLKLMVYKEINLKDFNQNNVVYCPTLINMQDNTYKTLLSDSSSAKYNVSKMVDEIENTLAIENIQTIRESVRSILEGYAPKSDDENTIYGIKKGLDFISDKRNKITEENLNNLYMMSIGNYLVGENKLLDENKYRHDAVYIVGSNISHAGLSYQKLNEFMCKFIAFINTKDNINIIIKSCMIHFYFAYIHPYFDGNGRMARLLHLWYLIQQGFNATLSVSFSQLISSSKNEYYKAYEIIEENLKISDVIDVTPFIQYFNANIFDKLDTQKADSNLVEQFQSHLNNGKITEKEKELFMFIISHYNDMEFSTKDLEKDFRNVAYATVRVFVLKFETLGLLSVQKYGQRNKYKLTGLVD